MSKMKQLDLLMQEAVKECEEMRRENGCSSSHLYHPYKKIVEHAFMQGFHAAGELVVRPMQENIKQDSELQTTIEEIARKIPIRASWRTALGARDYLETKLNQEQDDE
tara:strand:+ start:277 stop:600 length:324 start_codon:yes stop_codon:yes gene_type:complete